MNESGFLNKAQKKLEEVLLPVAYKLGKQAHMSALKDGIVISLPAMILGGIFLILAAPPVTAGLEGTNIFFEFLLSWKAWATANAATLLIAYNLTIGCISVFTVLGVSYNLARHYGMSAINNAVTSLLVFVAIAAPPTTLDGKLSITLANLGAPGMFTAIIVAMITVEIARFLINKNVKIKMPSQVPPAIAAPFEMLIPLAVSFLVFLLGNNLLISISGVGLVGVVQLIFKPLINVTDSVVSIVIVNLVTSGFWFFGIHGASIIGGLTTPITTANLAENALAYQAGEPLQHIFSGTFNTVFGGYITYPAMIIAIMIIARSARLKSLSKIAVAPSCFNINEPLIFGLPVVMNVMLIIPIIFCNTMNIIIAYFLMQTGVIGKFFISTPFSMPGPINAFLSTMDWKAPIAWIVIFAIDLVIFIPFAKGYDQVVQKEELEETN